MLDVMRSNARSSLIVIIFGAIIVSFIFSFGRGSSGFRTRTPETWAAKVNGIVATARPIASKVFFMIVYLPGGPLCPLTIP